MATIAKQTQIWFGCAQPMLTQNQIVDNTIIIDFVFIWEFSGGVNFHPRLSPLNTINSFLARIPIYCNPLHSYLALAAEYWKKLRGMEKWVPNGSGP